MMKPLSLYPLTPEQAIRRAMSAPPLPLNDVKASRDKEGSEGQQEASEGQEVMSLVTELYLN